ncbi:MAG: HAD-IIB family hydrolase [Coprobacillaceae bacterium]
MNKKYFFFDIDGTLAVGSPGKYIPESTKKAINKLREQGHFLAIATGRSYAMAYEHMKELGFDNMVSDGGNGVTINGELLGITPLNREKAIALIEECIEKDIIWAVSPDNKTRRLAPDERFYDFTKDIYMDTIVDSNLDIYSFEEIHKVYVACLPGEEKRLSLLKELPYARYHKEYIFVEPDDKSIGIKRIMDYYQADYKDVVVFGDEKNDIKMFIPEWTSIAMGNAIEPLKKRATYITTDVDKDGIYNACKHFNWI